MYPKKKIGRPRKDGGVPQPYVVRPLTGVDRNLMTPLVAGRIAAKNGRTMVKLIQLLEKSKAKDAEGKEVPLNTSSKLYAKIDKYRDRINRRLKTLAKWSDERVEDRLLYPTEKRRRTEAQYKLDGSRGSLLKDVIKSTDEADAGKTVRLALGSQYSYTTEHNLKVLRNEN